jgi:hypothetical protein
LVGGILGDTLILLFTIPFFVLYISDIEKVHQKYPFGGEWWISEPPGQAFCHVFNEYFWGTSGFFGCRADPDLQAACGKLIRQSQFPG